MLTKFFFRRLSKYSAMIIICFLCQTKEQRKTKKKVITKPPSTYINITGLSFYLCGTKFKYWYLNV